MTGVVGIGAAVVVGGAAAAVTTGGGGSAVVAGAAAAVGGGGGGTADSRSSAALVVVVGAGWAAFSLLPEDVAIQTTRPRAAMPPTPRPTQRPVLDFFG